MKNLQNLKKKLNNLGYELIFDRFGYWDNVPFAVNNNNPSFKTALAFSIYHDDSSSYIDCLDDNTPFSIIEKSLKANSLRLGYYDYSKNRLSKSHKYLEFDLEVYHAY